MGNVYFERGGTKNEETQNPQLVQNTKYEQQCDLIYKKTQNLTTPSIISYTYLYIYTLLTVFFEFIQLYYYYNDDQSTPKYLHGIE